MGSDVAFLLAPPPRPVNVRRAVVAYRLAVVGMMKGLASTTGISEEEIQKRNAIRTFEISFMVGLSFAVDTRGCSI